MFSLKIRTGTLRILIACSVAITASSCTQEEVLEQSTTIPSEKSEQSSEPIVNVVEPSKTPPQPTSSPVKPNPTMQDPTNVPTHPSPHPPTAAPTNTVEITRFLIDTNQSSVSYGVGETFLSQGNRYNYAIGVTTIVSGEILVDTNNPSDSTIGEITVDISAFQSDKSRRDKAIRDRWLQSSKFPVAVFSPTELRGLPNQYTHGDVLDFEIAGNLTVRDVSRPTIFTAKVSMNDERLTGQANTSVRMTDFDFDPPTVAGMIEAENNVDITFEFVALHAKVD